MRKRENKIREAISEEDLSELSDEQYDVVDKLRMKIYVKYRRKLEYRNEGSNTAWDRQDIEPLEVYYLRDKDTGEYLWGACCRLSGLVFDEIGVGYDAIDLCSDISKNVEDFMSYEFDGYRLAVDQGKLQAAMNRVEAELRKSIIRRR